MSIEVLRRTVEVYTIGFQTFWLLICFALGPSISETKNSYSYYIWCSFLFKIIYKLHWIYDVLTPITRSPMRPHFASWKVFSEAALWSVSYSAKCLKTMFKKRLLHLLFSQFTASDNRQCVGKCVSREKLLWED